MSTCVMTLDKSQKSASGGFTAAQALAWLEAKGQLNTSCTELAQLWSWSKSKVKRELVRWSTDGWIERQVSEDRRFTRIVYRGGGDGPAQSLENHGSNQPPVLEPDKTPDIYRWFTGVTPPVRTTGAGWSTKRVNHRTTGSGPPATGGPPKRFAARGMAFLVGAALAVLGLGMGYVSMRINQWSGATLAATSEAATLWQTGSAIADGFKMVLLVAAAILWGEGLKRWAWLLVVAWGVTLAYSVMAAAGFASLNIADSTAKRDSVASERARLATDIARKRSQLGWGASVETPPQQRSAAAVKVALQNAQPKVPRGTWKVTSGCTDVTIEPSRQACAEVLALRAELADARSRETTVAELRDLEAKLAKLPPVTAADPQAQMLSATTNWLSFGHAHFGEGDVKLLRFLLIMLVIELPGALGLSAGLEILRRVAFV